MGVDRGEVDRDGFGGDGDVPVELACAWVLLSPAERALSLLLVDAVADGLLDDPVLWDRYRAEVDGLLGALQAGEYTALQVHAAAMRSAGVA